MVAAGDGNLCDECLHESLLLNRGPRLDGVRDPAAQLCEDFRAGRDSGEKYDWASGPELTSTYADGTHDTWIATSGHDWWDGGSYWNVNTVIDLCKNF